MSGPAQARDDSHPRHGGPAHDLHDSHHGDGGPAQVRNDSQVRNGGPAQGTDDSQMYDGGPAQGDDDSQRWHGGPAWNPGLLADLRAAGEDLADLIEVRKAAENRARTLGHMDTALICPPWIADAENAARQALQDAYARAVPAPIRDWAARVPCLGSGELFPRIIAIVGDPCMATPLLPIARGDTGRGARSRPAGPPYLRSPHQLWQWCGVGDSRSKAREDVLGRKPEQADLLAAGKRSQIPPLLYVWSSQLVRAATPSTREGSARFGLPMSPAAAGSHYWKTFTGRKARPVPVHQHQCQNHVRPPGRPSGCGTSLHPEWGEPGSPWRPGHVNMDAHRITQKRLLMDLWRAAWELHEGLHPETAERRERRARARP
jgi:hypothetical protein